VARKPKQLNGHSAGSRQAAATARRHARANGLIYVSDAAPGICRQRRGSGFRYLSPQRRPIKSERTLARIRSLAIPPAYRDVWICPDPHGHIQATGRDARGRKQYRYHPHWRTSRDDGKFARMVEFGSRLPQLRRRLKRDLALAGLPRDKILAVVVTLLEETLIRVGNAEYAQANGSFGLTTLRDRHVQFLRDGRATFRFRGKGGRTREVRLDDKRLARIVRQSQEIPGQQLFQYYDDDGKRQPIDSGMVNDYLREAMGGEGAGFTAKDFRTWGATARAIAHLCCEERAEDLSDRAFTSCVVATAKKVAESLGNTPAVCRMSYINPVVFTAWRTGALDRLVPGGALAPRQLERVALRVLRAQAGAQGLLRNRP
jgi:DNA topoisomerase IB